MKVTLTNAIFHFINILEILIYIFLWKIVLLCEELVKDFQSAKEDGEKALETFLDERVYSRTKSFHDRMKKMKRKTFATASSDKPASGRSKQKVAEIEQEALKSVINLVDRTDSVDLETLMNSRVTDECLSLFNPDGTIRKNAKSQLISNMKLETFEPTAPYIAILDMV